MALVYDDAELRAQDQQPRPTSSKNLGITTLIAYKTRDKVSLHPRLLLCQETFP